MPSEFEKVLDEIRKRSSKYEDIGDVKREIINALSQRYKTQERLFTHYVLEKGGFDIRKLTLSDPLLVIISDFFNQCNGLNKNELYKIFRVLYDENKGISLLKEIRDTLVQFKHQSTDTPTYTPSPYISVITSEAIGLVEAKYGQSLEQGKNFAKKVDCNNFQDVQAFFNNGGQAGKQLAILEPGTYYINPEIFTIRTVPIIRILQGEIGLVIANEGTFKSDEQTLGRVVECDNFQDAEAFLKNGGQKGKQLAILTDGDYKINTDFFSVITTTNAYKYNENPNNLKVYKIDKDKIGILTTMVGKILPKGEIAGPIIEGHDNYQNAQKFLDLGGYKGLQEEVLQEGAWSLNPWFVEVEQVPLTRIEQEEVGVVISFVGKEYDKNYDQQPIFYGAEKSLYQLVPKGYKGVQKEPLTAGQYAINTRVKTVKLVPTTQIILNWSDQKKHPLNYDYELKQMKLISRDHFEIFVQFTQIIRIAAENAPKMICMVGYYTGEDKIYVTDDSGQVVKKYAAIRNLVSRVLTKVVYSHFQQAATGKTAIQFLNTRGDSQKEAENYIKTLLEMIGVEGCGTFMVDTVNLPLVVDSYLQEKQKQEAREAQAKAAPERLLEPEFVENPEQRLPEPEFVENPENRCPIILLLDTSYSMSGEAITELNQGVKIFQASVKEDELASLRVEIAVITFNSEIEVVQDFVTVDKFIPKTLEASGVTHMGKAIEKALELLEKRKQDYKNSDIQYYRPWIFLITDGQPTDTWQDAAKKIEEAETNRKLLFFAVGVRDADMETLSEISVCPPQKLNGLDFQSLFKWLSFSLQQVSVSKIGEKNRLPPTNAWEEITSKNQNTKQTQQTQQKTTIPNSDPNPEPIIPILVLDRDIFKDQRIKSNSEGEIWITQKYRYRKKYLIKIYYEVTPARIKKLEVMVAYKPKNFHGSQQAWAWPEYLLADKTGKIIGFVMEFIEDSKLLFNIYNPQRRKQINSQLHWSVDWLFLHHTAKNIATIIQSLHSQDYVIGDMKPQNILVNRYASASIIDTDSFQVHHPQTKEIYHCLVGSEEFTPPELLEKELAKIVQTPTHDNFRLALIIYHLLFGEHPFKGKWIGTEEPPKIDELIRLGFWCYAPHSKIQPGPRTIPLEIVHPKIQKCFQKCFNDGHYHPEKRPTPQNWVDALESAINDLVQCKRVDTHWYSKTYGKCYWCEREEKLEVDIFSDSKTYHSLEKLLQNKKWKEADLETKYIMLKFAGRIDQGWLDKSSLENFPTKVILQIDQRWRQHSDERFGFATQKRIYLETGNKLEQINWETYNHFGEKVGWREGGMWKNYFDLEFSLNSPEGHLPFCCAGFNVCVIAHLALLKDL